MSRYRVSFTPVAERQITEAYEWGVDYWGPERAEAWLRSLYESIFSRLTLFPLSCPIAPEAERVKREIRHYLFNRYRILFEVRGNNVRVLWLTGPFNRLDVSLPE